MESSFYLLKTHGSPTDDYSQRTAEQFATAPGDAGGATTSTSTLNAIPEDSPQYTFESTSPAKMNANANSLKDPAGRMPVVDIGGGHVRVLGGPL